MFVVWVIKDVLFVFEEVEVIVYFIVVDFGNWFGQKVGEQVVFECNLFDYEFESGDMVGGFECGGVVEINFVLFWCDFVV